MTPTKGMTGVLRNATVVVDSVESDGSVYLLVNGIDLGWFSIAALAALTIEWEKLPLEVGDLMQAPDGNVLEIVAPKRERENGIVEYALWNDVGGYVCRSAEVVESWARLPR